MTYPAKKEVDLFIYSLLVAKLGEYQSDPGFPGSFGVMCNRGHK